LRCHCEERLARRSNLDRTSAQRPEIASLPLAMTIGWAKFYLILTSGEMGLFRNSRFGEINSRLGRANSRFGCYGNWLATV